MTDDIPFTGQVREVNGESLVLVSCGFLSGRLGVATLTVKRWESLGIIPTAHFFNDAGHRLYSLEEVEVMAKAFVKIVGQGKLFEEQSYALEKFSKEVNKVLGKLRKRYGQEN